jgi:hypothetical protein
METALAGPPPLIDSGLPTGALARPYHTVIYFKTTIVMKMQAMALQIQLKTCISKAKYFLLDNERVTIKISMAFAVFGTIRI